MQTRALWCLGVGWGGGGRTPLGIPNRSHFSFCQFGGGVSLMIVLAGFLRFWFLVLGFMLVCGSDSVAGQTERCENCEAIEENCRKEREKETSCSDYVYLSY